MNTFTATVVLLLLYCFLVISAGREYQRIAKLRGDPVLMWCNTTKSGGVKWSQNTTIGRRFSYVYINGSVEGSYSVRRRFSVSEHSLKIYNAQRTDSGRYDCFDSGEVRRYGYELNVTAKPDRYYYRTVDVGQTVKFPCETKLPENVNWKRMDIRHEYIYRGGTITPYTDPRLTVDKNNSYTLTILNVTAKDSTLYGCFEDDGVGNKRYYGLTVTETPLEYTRVDVLTGETVSLSCDTSADDVMWTYDTNDGYVDYIYWNQRIDNDKPHLSVIVNADHSHNLTISRIQRDDRGRYDCYDNNGLRVVGYQLTEFRAKAADIEQKTKTPVIVASIVFIIIVILAVVVAVVGYKLRCARYCGYIRTPRDKPDAETLLHVAARNGEAEKVIQLLADKAYVNAARDIDGVTSLYLAAKHGHIEVVKLLLENDADVNASRHTDGDTPLHVAGWKGHSEVVKQLLDYKADVNARKHTDDETDGETPLHPSACSGYTEVVKLLLDHNADANAAREKDGVTPLYIAAKQGHKEVVKLLLDNKADVDTRRRKDGDTPLLVAAFKGFADVVELLLDRKADVTATKYTDDAMPRDLAEMRGHEEVVKLLDKRHV